MTRRCCLPHALIKWGWAIPHLHSFSGVNGAVLISEVSELTPYILGHIKKIESKCIPLRLGGGGAGGVVHSMLPVYHSLQCFPWSKFPLDGSFKKSEWLRQQKHFSQFWKDFVCSCLQAENSAGCWSVLCLITNTIKTVGLLCLLIRPPRPFFFFLKEKGKSPQNPTGWGVTPNWQQHK